MSSLVSSEASSNPMDWVIVQMNKNRKSPKDLALLKLVIPLNELTHFLVVRIFLKSLEITSVVGHRFES